MFKGNPYLTQNYFISNFVNGLKEKLKSMSAMKSTNLNQVYEDVVL